VVGIRTGMHTKDRFIRECDAFQMANIDREGMWRNFQSTEGAPTGGPYFSNVPRSCETLPPSYPQPLHLNPGWCSSDTIAYRCRILSTEWIG